MKELFSCKNEVIYGNQLGRTIGYPTANITCKDFCACNFEFGAYLSITEIGEKYYLSFTNFGIHPTIKKLNEPILETYIFNFNENLYGKVITVHVLKLIRREQKFDSLNELKCQLVKDEENCRKLIKRYKISSTLSNL